MNEKDKLTKGTLGRITGIISSVNDAIEAIRQDKNKVQNSLEVVRQDPNKLLFRGDDLPLIYAYIDLFLLSDCLTVLKRCAHSHPIILEVEKSIETLEQTLINIVQSKFSKNQQIKIISEALDSRIEDLTDYLLALPKNISPSGDGFGNLLSKRHSIQALMEQLIKLLGNNPFADELKNIDQLLKTKSNPEWLAKTDCAEQLLVLAPLSRWWFYRQS